MRPSVQDNLAFTASPISVFHIRYNYLVNPLVLILTPTLVSLISSKIPFTAAYYYNMSLHISIDCIFQTVYCSLCLSVSHSEALKFIDFAPKKIHLSTLSFLSYFVSFFILQTFLNNSPLILTIFFSFLINSVIAHQLAPMSTIK